MKSIKLPLLLLGGVMVTSQLALTEELIDHHQFTLDNGLRVVVHEDHKTPKVALGVWYHVGSKDEPLGKSGFAHLFEHLMFNGTEHYDGEYFVPLKEIGATGINGTTSLDRTNYYETVPTSGLERALWLESERMGHLRGVISQDKLDEQRAVVKNEKRSSDNRPRGMVRYHLMEGLFPADHPYHHSTIGSMEDLGGASVEDVKSWFGDYYGAANAVVVLSGDVTVKIAKELTQKYFGHIPAGPPVSHRTSWIPERSRNTAEVILDNVPQISVSWNWVVPGRTTEDADVLRLAAAVLGGSKTSRLYRELVHERELATTVSARISTYELASIFSINVSLKKGVEAGDVEKIVTDILAKFLKKGPKSQEMKQAKTGAYSQMVRGFESISSKGHVLAQGALYANDPTHYAKSYDRYAAATNNDVQQVSREWLKTGYHKITVAPFGDHKTANMRDDRATMPGLTQTSKLKMPPFTEGRLSNGIRVVLSPRKTIPVVEVRMVFDAGSAADQDLGKKGVAGFALSLMNEGTKKYSSLELSEKKALLGANMFVTASGDRTTIGLSALGRNLSDSIELWADFIRNPAFRQKDLERDRAFRLTGLSLARVNPVLMASRTFYHLIYGNDHAYGVTLDGREEVIKSYNRDDMIRFHESWIRPDNATLYVVGDTTLAVIIKELEKAFGDWQPPKRAMGSKKVDTLPYATQSRVILLHKPNAVQSVIRAGHLMPGGTDPRHFAIGAVNQVLGGGFSARLNMNLREDKGWAYGANSSINSRLGPQVFSVRTNVQTDKTAAALKEILKEIKGVQKDIPITPEEYDLVVKSRVLSLPGRFETNRSLIGYLQYVDRFKRPYDYLARTPDRYATLDPEKIHETARAVLRPEALTWVIVGDLDKIEQEVRALDLGPVEVWDPEGHKIR